MKSKEREPITKPSTRAKPFKRRDLEFKIEVERTKDGTYVSAMLPSKDLPGYFTSAPKDDVGITVCAVWRLFLLRTMRPEPGTYIVKGSVVKLPKKKGASR